MFLRLLVFSPPLPTNLTLPREKRDYRTLNRGEKYSDDNLQRNKVDKSKNGELHHVI